MNFLVQTTVSSLLYSCAIIMEGNVTALCMCILHSVREIFSKFQRVLCTGFNQGG